MKQCPVCHAIAFDDAAICYGCLHRFAEGEEVLQFEQAVSRNDEQGGFPECGKELSAGSENRQVQVASLLKDAERVVVPVEVASEGGSWMVRVEVWGASSQLQPSRTAPKGKVSRAVLRRQRKRLEDPSLACAGLEGGVR